jgi:phosphoglycerol transferase MdoB-like AlkP superfamily enzyme
MDTNKIYSHVFKEEGYVFPKKSKIYYTIWLHIILLFYIKIVGYEYIGFQFSQNDKYAQRLCVYIFFLILLLIKNLQSMCVLCAYIVH